MNGKVFALVLLVVGVAVGLPQHINNCDNWCIAQDGSYTCCNKLPKCPVDNRKPGDCSRPQAFIIGALGGASGPQRCYNDSDCTFGAICCQDNCLRYKKCTNVRRG